MKREKEKGEYCIMKSVKRLKNTSFLVINALFAEFQRWGAGYRLLGYLVKKNSLKCTIYIEYPCEA